jgi:diguanylate cyclase (GGDEF)-like protein
MTLDLRTLSFVVSLVSFIAAFLMVFVSILAKQYRAIIYWAIGNTFNAIGFTLLMERDFIPEFYSVVLANVTLGIGMFVVFLGMVKFVGKPLKLLPILFVLLLFFPVFLIFTYTNDSFLTRSVISAVYSGALLLSTGLILFIGSPPALRFSYWFTGFLFTLQGLFQIVRVFAVIKFSPNTSLFSQNGLQVINFISMAAFIILWTMGSVLMVTQRLSMELKQTARIDFLTQTYNRRAAQERMEQEVKRAERKGSVFSIILIDIDLFKEINDRFGHPAGDAALSQISDIMRKNLRLEDMHSRWGGDEFLIMLVETPINAAAVVAERLRNTIESQKIKYQHFSFDCSLSIGIAGFGLDDSTLEETITQADSALYESKALGGNSIVIGYKNKKLDIVV